MVAQSVPVRHLISADLLRTAAATDTGIDARHMDFVNVTPQERAPVRAQVEGIVALELTPGRWVVSSGCRPDHRYSVDVCQAGRTIRCGCDAGRVGEICKHAELVRQRIAQQQAAQVIAQAEQLALAASQKRETIAHEAKRRGVSELTAIFA